MRAGGLVLRRWREEYIDQVVEAIDSSFEELQSWLSWAQKAPTRDELLWLIKDGEAGFEQDQAWEYFMFESEGGALVGMVGLNSARVAVGAIEVSYWVRTDRTGRGYATTATRALVDAVFDGVEEVSAVEIRMDAANVASATVPRKLGFELLREEYSEMRAKSHTGREQVWRLRRKR